MVVTARTFEQIALDEPDRQWELRRGRLREKPGMTASHNDLAWELALQLGRQLDPGKYRGRVNASHLRHSAESYYIPDLAVVPAELVRPLLDRADVLEVYRDPLPLVVEIWSPSTGDYDLDTKLANCRERGDLEIWRLHPYERTLTVWRRQADGSYAETVYRAGTVRPVALPGVVIDLDALLA